MKSVINDVLGAKRAHVADPAEFSVTARIDSFERLLEDAEQQVLQAARAVAARSTSATRADLVDAALALARIERVVE